MKEFSIFLQQYWRIILESILVITSFILLLCKKKGINIYDSSYWRDLVVLVNDAEEMFPEPGSGEKKLKYVIDSFLSKHEYRVKDLSFVIDFCLKPSIEQILCTPTKKGGHTSEKKSHE